MLYCAVTLNATSATRLRFPLDIGSQTAALAERQLGAGSCSLVLVARELGLHERTLQRRLSEQCLHFEDIIDRLRRERASEYLPYSAIPLAQVAALLGYSDQTALTRACRRWLEQPPKIATTLFGEYVASYGAAASVAITSW